MINRIGVQLSRARRVLLAATAIAAVALPFMAGIVTAPLRASIQAAEQQQAAGPRFEVASVKPCDGGSAPGGPGGRSGGAGPRFPPGRFVFECGTVEMLINAAYVANGEPLLNDEFRLAAMRSGPTAAFPLRIRGGPDWARKERFTIEAKAEISTGLPGNQAPERKILMGPMLRALLEERFRLKLHREIQEDVPMYALTVAPGGLKIKPVGPDGGCTPPVPGQGPRMDEEIALVRHGGKPICGHGIMGGFNGPNQALVLNGHTMSRIANALSGLVDRHVLDRTGVDGKFVLYLEYALDDMTPFDMVGAAASRTTEPPTGPTITTALREQLGLRLEPTKGPKGYIVIDHIERPTPDSPVGAAAAPGAAGSGRASGAER